MKPSLESLQNKEKDVKSKVTVKDKVDKNEHKTPDEPTTSTKTIFKRTALEEKLIAFSRSADEILSDSDSDAETQQKGKKHIDTGVTKVPVSLVSQDNEGGEIKGSVSNVSDSSICSETASVANVAQTSGATKIVTTATSKPERTDKKEVVENSENLETEKSDVLPCSKDQMIMCEGVNEPHNIEKKKLSSEQEEALPEPTRHDQLSEMESTDVTMSGNDDESNKEVAEKLKRDKDTELDTKELHEAHKSTEPKEDTKLNTMIQDLQKYGTGMDIEVKTKKEKNKSEIKKIKREKPKPEPPKLTDVNFFSAVVAKQNKKKSSKEEKTQATKVKKEEKSENTSKDKKKLKKKLSESKLATTKEKSKIQRYKELKKLVKDSENNINTATDPVKSSASVSGEIYSTKKTERTKETKELVKDSKKILSTTTSSGKVSASGKSESPDKTERTKISKEPVKVSNKEVNVATDYAKISTSKSGKKDIARKTERNKDIIVKDYVKKTSVVAGPGKSVLVISSDSELSSGEIKKSNIVESDMDNNLEDDSEENELLRIFNDYDPDNDEPDVMDSMDNHMMNIDVEDDKIQLLPKSIAGLKRPSTESINPVGFKKQRVAHQPSLVS